MAKSDQDDGTNLTNWCLLTVVGCVVVSEHNVAVYTVLVLDNELRERSAIWDELDRNRELASRPFFEEKTVHRVRNGLESANYLCGDAGRRQRVFAVGAGCNVARSSRRGDSA